MPRDALSTVETCRLFERWRNGDADAGERVVEGHRGLVERLARSYLPRAGSLDWDYLMQAGCWD